MSTKKLGQFSGKWVAIDPLKQKIVAVAITLKEISSFVSGKTENKHKIKAVAFKVPRKNEGPYVLTNRFIN